MSFAELASSSTLTSALSGAIRSNFLGALLTLPVPNQTLTQFVLSEFLVPRSPQEVHSFLGLCSYFWRFVINFADIALPLTDLLRKNAAFSWGAEQVNAITALISALTSPPVLARFGPATRTELCTDASGHGSGTIRA